MSLQPNNSFWQAAAAILQVLQISPTPTNLKLLAAWALCEQKTGQSGNAWGWNNPLSGTLPLGGSTAMNAVGVQFYPSQAVGARANAWQILGLTSAGTPGIDYYPQLRQALRNSAASTFFAATHEMATWGTALSCIQQDYAVLGVPPAALLPSAPASAPVPAVPTAASAPWGPVLIGVGGSMLAGAALWWMVRQDNRPKSHILRV